MTSTPWQRYLLPAFTFMSVVIGGGYATGRELVEFFMPAGPIGGLLGMVVTAAVWSLIFALSLELARTTQSFDYRLFFRQLLGRGWVLFEIAYLALLLLVLAVLGAASGEIAADIFGAPPWTGTLAFLLLIAVLTWLGTAAIEAFLSAWGVVLVVAYVVFTIVCLAAFGDRIDASFAAAQGPGPGWFRGGITYAGYNIAIAPALLFCARHQRCRRETLLAGALAGPIAILPAVVFYIAMQGWYPEIMSAPIPLQMLLHALDAPWLAVGMQVAIFGTLVQTGIGILHGFNERLLGARAGVDSGTDTGTGTGASAAAGTRAGTDTGAGAGTGMGRNSGRARRLAVSLALSLTAMLLATRIGLIDLIAKGYGYLAWAIILIYAVPLLTIGVWRIWKLAPVTRRLTAETIAGK